MRVLRLLLLAAAAPLCGCAVSMPDLPIGRFEQGQVAAVADAARREVAQGAEENRALVLNVLGECEMLMGDVDAAWGHLGEAGRIMGNWSVSGGEEFSAVVGAEGSKTYRGDPYEKAMNCFYLGLCYLWRGEPDNARAAFKKGILADGESGDEKFQVDFTLLLWMAGRMSLLMGLPEEAEGLFEEARTANAFCLGHGSRGQADNPLLLEPRAGNLVLLIAVGMGPEKFAGGHDLELVQFRPQFHPAARAQVRLDGELVGPSWIFTDVDYQARTRGGTEMEGIRQGKALFKNVTRVAGDIAVISAIGDDSRSGSRDKLLAGIGLWLLSGLTRAEADVRYWPTLPSTIQGIALDVTPGDHTVVLEFLDRSGVLLPELSQEWSVRVPEGGESYYFFRSLPGLDRSPQVTP